MSTRASSPKWAVDPAVIAAAKASNASGGMPGMNAGQWAALAETEAAVKGTMSAAAGKFVDSLDSKTVNKGVVRDNAGNGVATLTKVALYNLAHRPVYKTAITGVARQQNSLTKDVAT